MNLAKQSQNWLPIGLILGCWSALQAAEPPVDYSRQIRPILADNCLACHGPDAAERQAGLRLDVRASATAAAESGEKAIVPGKASQSELIKRIHADEPSVRMPPAEAKKTLTAAQKSLLARWIDEGAKYDEHWAFVAPERPSLPEVQDKSWPRRPIDGFILERLEREGLSPAGEALPTTPIARLPIPGWPWKVRPLPGLISRR